MNLRRVLTAGAIVGLSLFSNASIAGTIILNAVDSGSYFTAGPTAFHDPTNTNYLAGFNEGTGDQHRNFFIFDLTGINGPIKSAKLRLDTGLFRAFFGSGAVGPEPYSVFGVTTPISVLTAGGTVPIAVFNDLAGGDPVFSELSTGAPYGSRTYTAADENQIRDIELNSMAIAALNAASGEFAIGGALTDLAGAQSPEFVFGADGFNSPDFDSAVGNYVTNTVQLILVVPEPGTLALFGLGLAGLGFARRRKVA